MKIANITYIFIVLFILNGCSLLYVAKQGIYQLKLVATAEPIEQALRKTDLDLNQRKKLELITKIREFAVSRLHLSAHKNYKDVNLSWSHVIHTVSASDALRFKPYLWWFPIIGSVPYKGFFDKEDALAEEQRLSQMGLETQMHPIAGYSTLGFFADPIWPNMLLMHDFSLTDLIIHELTHATVYIPNQTSFNETLATFIGTTGTRLFVEQQFGKQSKELKQLNSYYEQLTIQRNFFYELFKKLDAVYKSILNDQEKQLQKTAIFKEAQQQYLLLPLNDGFKNLDWSSINNAYLLSFKRYNHDDTVFEALLNAVHGDFARFFEEVGYYALTSDPFLSLKNRAQALAGKS